MKEYIAYIKSDKYLDYRFQIYENDNLIFDKTFDNYVCFLSYVVNYSNFNSVSIQFYM